MVSWSGIITDHNIRLIDAYKARWMPIKDKELYNGYGILSKTQRILLKHEGYLARMNDAYK